jgi:hypothetical protein
MIAPFGNAGAGACANAAVGIAATAAVIPRSSNAWRRLIDGDRDSDISPPGVVVQTCGI